MELTVLPPYSHCSFPGINRSRFPAPATCPASCLAPPPLTARRPHREDYELADVSYTVDNARQMLYTQLKSGAESGWDFSTRWFIPGAGQQGSGELTQLPPPPSRPAPGEELGTGEVIGRLSLFVAR